MMDDYKCAKGKVTTKNTDWYIGCLKPDDMIR